MSTLIPLRRCHSSGSLPCFRPSGCVLESSLIARLESLIVDLKKANEALTKQLNAVQEENQSLKTSILENAGRIQEYQESIEGLQRIIRSARSSGSTRAEFSLSRIGV